MTETQVLDMGDIGDAIENLKALSDVLINIDHRKCGYYSETKGRLGLLILRETMIINDCLDFMECKKRTPEIEPASETSGEIVEKHYQNERNHETSQTHEMTTHEWSDLKEHCYKTCNLGKLVDDHGIARDEGGGVLYTLGGEIQTSMKNMLDILDQIEQRSFKKKKAPETKPASETSEA